jgi:hypothetical protein
LTDINANGRAAKLHQYWHEIKDIILLFAKHFFSETPTLKELYFYGTTDKFSSLKGLDLSEKNEI